MPSVAEAAEVAREYWAKIEERRIKAMRASRQDEADAEAAARKAFLTAQADGQGHWGAAAAAELARRAWWKAHPRKTRAQSSREFFASPKWEKLRYQTLRANRAKYGRLTCECCKATESNGWHCDHIKPRSKFPELELDPTNTQILCRACNMSKSNTDSIDWREPVEAAVDG